MDKLHNDGNKWTEKSTKTLLFWANDMTTNLKIHQKESLKQFKVSKFFYYALFLFSTVASILSYVGIDKCTPNSPIKYILAASTTLGVTGLSLMAKLKPDKLAYEHKVIAIDYVALITKIQIVLQSPHKPDPEAFKCEVMKEYKEIANRDVPQLKGLKSPADLISLVVETKAVENMKARGGKRVIHSDFIGTGGSNIFDNNEENLATEIVNESAKIQKKAKKIKSKKNLKKVVIIDEKGNKREIRLNHKSPFGIDEK